MKDIIIIVNVIKTFDFEVRLFQITTRHRASASTRWHFAFGAMLS